MLVPLVLVVDHAPSTFLAIRRIGRTEAFETHAFQQLPSLWELKTRGLATNRERPCCVVFEAGYAAEISALLEQNVFEWHTSICLYRNTDSLTTVQSSTTTTFILVEMPFSMTMVTELLRQSLHGESVRTRIDCTVLGDRIGTLTLREREIYKQISSGLSSKEIANDLGISTKTFYVHRSNMMRKIGTRTAAELARLCALYSITRNSQRKGSQQTSVCKKAEF